MTGSDSSRARERALSIDLRLPAEPVDFGKRFEVIVIRTWPADHRTEPFDVASLAPLQVAPTGTARETLGGETSESLGFDAWAFESGTIELGPLTVRAVPIAGGEVRVAASAKRKLVVRRLEADRAVELPGAPLPAPRTLPWMWIAGIGGVAALAAFLVWRTGRLRGVRTESEYSRTVRAIETIRQKPGDDHEQSRALSQTLRRWIEQRYELPATRQTTDEFLRESADSTRLDADVRDALHSFLAATDRIKFAQHRPTEDERSTIHAAIDRILTATAPEESP